MASLHFTLAVHISISPCWMMGPLEATPTHLEADLAVANKKIHNLETLVQKLKTDMSD